MVTTFDAQPPVTPAGKPLMTAPVAPVVAYVVVVIAVLTQLVCVPPAIRLIVLSGRINKEPVWLTFPHPPVNNTVYVKVPVTVGVPLIVTTLEAQLPVTPDGNPMMLAPVAPVVAYVVFKIGSPKQRI